MMAEVVGFEPTDLSVACFQDRCTRPLCDTSNTIKNSKFFELCQPLPERCFLENTKWSLERN